MTDDTAAREAVLAASERYFQAVRELDVDQVATTWTEDCVMYAPDAEDVRSRRALRELLAATYPQVTVENAVIHSREIEPCGDLAVEIGTYTERLKVGTDQPRDLRGRYTFVWRRRGDGSWKIHRGIYNYSAGSFQHAEVADRDAGSG